MEWIPCNKKLPDETGEYLVTIAFKWANEIAVGEWDGAWLGVFSERVIAWMPLPKPYKEGAKK